MKLEYLSAVGDRGQLSGIRNNKTAPKFARSVWQYASRPP
jgi:hypothetical protein